MDSFELDLDKNKTSGILTSFNNNKKLLVAFGGVSQGIGMPVFEFFKSISHFDCDKIFIRDLTQSWYQEGVDKQITSLNELKDYLRDLIEDNGYDEVVFLGNSMGGFAAILFGSILNVSRVIAFAPQSFIGKIDRIRHFDFRWKRQMKRIHRNKELNKIYFDLVTTLKKLEHPLPPVEIYYSKSHRLDKLHSERLRIFNNVKLNGYSGGGHSLVKELKSNGTLATLLNQIFSK